MKKRITYKNNAEEQFCQWIEQKGFSVSKRGWPDFLCTNGKELMAVEVKDTATHPLKKEQHSVARILTMHGIKTYRWDAENKTLELVTENTKRTRPKRQRPRVRNTSAI